MVCRSKETPTVVQPTGAELNLIESLMTGHHDHVDPCYSYEGGRGQLAVARELVKLVGLPQEMSYPGGALGGQQTGSALLLGLGQCWQTAVTRGAHTDPFRRYCQLKMDPRRWEA